MKHAWPEVSLGEICELKYGKALAAAGRDDGEFPVYGSNGIVGHHSTSLTKGATIIVGRKGSLGEVNFSNENCWPIDTTYYIDETATDSDLGWLVHALRSLPLQDLNRAAAVPGLNRDDAYRQRLQLPPLDEQRRIAAILDRTDAIRGKRRSILDGLDDLVNSIARDALEGQSWPTVSIGEIASVKGGKRLPKGSAYSTVRSAHPYIRVTDLREGGVSTTDLKYLTPAVQRTLARYTVASDDVVISIAGSIGVVAVVPHELDGANLTENAAKIVPREKGLYFGWRMPSALRRLRLRLQVRSGGSRSANSPSFESSS